MNVQTSRTLGKIFFIANKNTQKYSIHKIKNQEKKTKKKTKHKKMSMTYKMNKKHIYKWRKSNMPRVLEINKKSHQKNYAWKKIQRIFLNILIDFQRNFRKNEILIIAFKNMKKNT